MKRIVAFLAAVFLGTTCVLCGCSSGVAQVVLDFEQELLEEVQTLREKNPTYTYEFTPQIEKVGCFFWLVDYGQGEEMIEKYRLRETFREANVRAGYSLVELSFAREDFTEAVYRKLQRLKENEPQFRDLSFSFGGGGTTKRLPNIACHAENVSPLEYESTEVERPLLSDDRGFIIKSKAEYEEYIDYFLERETFSEGKELINNRRGLYDEAFFEEYTLIITGIVSDSSSIHMEVENLYLSENKVYAVISTSMTREATADDVRARFFTVKVKKSAVADVTEVITLE